MSKQLPIKAPTGSNDANPRSVSHRRRDSASSMYANPDTDPDYQQDPVIGRDANVGERVGQVNGHDHHESGNQSPQTSK
jgi:hypothetical protein